MYASAREEKCGWWAVVMVVIGGVGGDDDDDDDDDVVVEVVTRGGSCLVYVFILLGKGGARVRVVQTVAGARWAGLPPWRRSSQCGSVAGSNKSTVNMDGFELYNSCIL